MVPDRLVEPLAWAGHAPFVMWFIECWEPQQVVELGVHSGNSFFAMCQAVKRAGLRCSLVGVDSWKGDAQAGFYGEDVYQAVRAHCDATYRSFASLMRCDFDEAVAKFADGSIDLLHVDGCHEYDAVRHDYQSWLPKMSGQGVVLFHDTQVREPATFGVWRLWAEIKRYYPHCEFVHSHGLGVLFVGGELSKSRQVLRDGLCDRNAFDQLSSLFSTLGTAIASERGASIRSDVLVREVRELTHEVELRGASLARVHGVLEAVRAEKDRYSERASAASGLEATLAKVRAEHDGLAAKLVQLGADIEARDRARAELQAARDVAVAELGQERERLQETQSAHESELTALRSQLEAARADVVSRATALAHLHAIVEAIRTDGRAQTAALQAELASTGSMLRARELEHERVRAAMDSEIDRERAAHRATEADRVRILRSNSMKVLSPLRAIRRLFSNPGLQLQMTKGALARGCRWLYDRLPISMETRLRHRARLAGRAPGLLVASGSPPESVPGVVRVKQPLVLVPMATLPCDRADTTSQSGADVARESVVIRPSESPMVSVIVPVHNQWDYTLACIKSLVASEPELEFEVILADDLSTDETVKAAQLVQGLVVCRQERNLGFLRNCNAAALKARGRYLLLLNNDTQVQPRALSQMLNVFSTRPDAGLVGAKLVYPDGTLQEAGGIVWRDGSAWNYGRNSDPSFGEFNYLKEVDYCSGACIMVPTALWRQLGGFDDRYSPAYCEDTDLAFSVRAAGKRVYYQPAAVVVHFEGKSHGTDTSQGVKAYQVANQQKFVERWRDTLERDHFANGERVFVARDRSRHKKCILVIDHYVPQPDRDAGSRSMLCIMQVLLEMGLNVKFWPHNLHYDRHYGPPLEALGVEIIHGNRFGGSFDSWIRQYGRELDHILLSRPHISVEFLDAIAQNCRAKVLFYGHDLHHERMRLQAEVTADPELKSRADSMQDLEESIWRRVDIVCYPSDSETEHVRRRCPNVTARTLPAYFFEPLEVEVPGPDRRAGILFVAGFAHPPNVDAAKWLVGQIMPIIRAAVPGVHLWLAGSNPTDEVKALGSSDVTVTGYVPDEELDSLYRRCRVAVVPLRFGAGVKHKVLEAMHRGTPLVTTPVGAQGLSGLCEAAIVVDDAHAASQAIVSLLADDLKWRALSRAGLAYVAKRYSSAAMTAVLREELYVHR